MHYKVLSNTGKHKDESKNHPDSPPCGILHAFIPSIYWHTDVSVQFNLVTPSVVRRPAALATVGKLSIGSETQIPEFRIQSF